MGLTQEILIIVNFNLLHILFTLSFLPIYNTRFQELALILDRYIYWLIGLLVHLLNKNCSCECLKTLKIIVFHSSVISILSHVFHLATTLVKPQGCCGKEWGVKGERESLGWRWDHSGEWPGEAIDMYIEHTYVSV